MKNFIIKTDLPNLQKKTTEPFLSLLQVPLTHKEVLRYILYRNNLDKWELNRNNIAKHLKLSESTINRIFNILRELDILSSFRKGNYYFYTINIQLSKIAEINIKAGVIFDKKQVSKIENSLCKAGVKMIPEQVSKKLKAGVKMRGIYLNTLLNIKLIYSYHHLLSTYLCKKERQKTGSKIPKNFQTEPASKNDNDDKKNNLKNDSESYNENQTDNKILEIKKNGEKKMKNENFNLNSILETLEQIEVKEKQKINSFTQNPENTLPKKSNSYNLSSKEKKEDFAPLNEVTKNETEQERIFRELKSFGFGKFNDNSEEDQRQRILKFMYGKDLVRLSQIIETVKMMGIENPSGYIYKTYDNPNFKTVPELPESKTKQINEEIAGLIKYFKLSMNSTSSRHDIVRLIINKYKEYKEYNKNKMDWLQKRLDSINNTAFLPENIKKDMIYRAENLEEITSKTIHEILELTTMEKLKECFVNENYLSEWERICKFLAYFRDNPKHRNNAKVINFHRVNPKTITNELFNNG